MKSRGDFTSEGHRSVRSQSTLDLYRFFLKQSMSDMDSFYQTICFVAVWPRWTSVRTDSSVSSLKKYLGRWNLQLTSPFFSFHHRSSNKGTARLPCAVLHSACCNTLAIKQNVTLAAERGGESRGKWGGRWITLETRQQKKHKKSSDVTCFMEGPIFRCLVFSLGSNGGPAHK